MNHADFKPSGQVGQDQFVFDVLYKDMMKRGATSFMPGTFLDVGCNHPTENSNTWALEQLGWSGILIDRDPTSCQLCREKRAKRTRVIEGDAVSFEWKALETKQFDYVSLDVDWSTLQTLAAMLLGGITGRIWTVEHDAYAYPQDTENPRRWIRALMKEAGYLVAEKDVEASGNPFEDWWIHPDLAPQLIDLRNDAYRKIL